MPGWWSHWRLTVTAEVAVEQRLISARVGVASLPGPGPRSLGEPWRAALVACKLADLQRHGRGGGRSLDVHTFGSLHSNPAFSASASSREQTLFNRVCCGGQVLCGSALQDMASQNPEPRKHPRCRHTKGFSRCYKLIWTSESGVLCGLWEATPCPLRDFHTDAS